ncbi:MAG TPA: CHAT domain-containing protein [Pirellulales bacterium]|nr:CHAT domain-containing protein [Pirellulales bacterium]
MTTLRRPSCVPRVSSLISGMLPVMLVMGALNTNAYGQGMQSAPQPSYFLLFPTFYDGQYTATLQTLAGLSGGAIKNPAAGGFWIDSICYATMTGECYYQMGNHALASQHYANALRLLMRFNNWMLSVQFPLAITPMPPQQRIVVPWYVSQRATVVGAYPPTMNILQGNINNNAAIMNGGVVQQAVLMPLYAQEIVRCSCLAIRRWRELMGPACPHSDITKQLVQVLSARPALPNHWSEAWVDTQLGLAYSAAGKVEQARKTLQQAELAGGAFDHPFTGTVLLELGRLDLAAGDFKSAERNFLEASWAAANYADYTVIEEALRYGALNHFLAKGNEPYGYLAPATAWATAQSISQLNASLLLSAAENLSYLNQPEAAAASLNLATGVTARTNMLLGKVGARMNYLRALVSYQLGRVDDGNVALAAAMTFQMGGSLWLYHIGLVDGLWLSNDLTERTAVDLYTNVLRDPTPGDWLTEPLESLSVLSIPHVLSYEHWFEAALARKSKDHELAFEIADMTRRHRFFTTLDAGGRLLNLRWLLEAPEKALDQTALLQRQTILARYPAYLQKAQRVRELRQELKQLPLLPEEKEIADQQGQLLAEMATLSGEQETLLRHMTVAREPANLVFPPLRTFKQVQGSLAEGQQLLVFFTTSRFSYSFLLGKEKYDYAEIKPPKKFPVDITSMLRKWGNFEQNKEMKLDDLVSGAWQGPAQQILSVLVKNSKTDFTKTTDELIIVPDGVLWYIPFEALPVSEGSHSELLINKMRIRYAPTAGLAVGETRHRRPNGNMAVVLGRLFPRDAPNLIDRQYEDLARAMPGTVAIRGKLPAHGGIFSSLFDRMIVLNEVMPGTAYDWSPLQVDNKTPGGTLAQWLSLPFGGPDQIILPAFRTPAERALKNVANETMGNDVFLSICGLMATGARTVLISRWRTGGQTSIDLVREFAQELPHTTASDAWQRSVQVVRHSQLNPAAEPRINLTPKQEPPTADNPFFWAGYLLVDTGALPMTDGEEEEVAQVVVVAPAANPNGKMPEAGAVPPGGVNPPRQPVLADGRVKPGVLKPAEKPDKEGEADPAGSSDVAGDAADSDSKTAGSKTAKAKRVVVPRKEPKKPVTKNKRAPNPA